MKKVSSINLADRLQAASRLNVLQLAEKLGSISEACRQLGVDRRSFYTWRTRHRTEGFEGLIDRLPIHRSHPQTTPEPVVERIKELALMYPEHGCNRHEKTLAHEGIKISANAVQRILNRAGLGSRKARSQASAGAAARNQQDTDKARSGRK
ncbi:helix-turn-helix domain-containing protein [Paracoccus sp. KR1-242]|uniref:helix-turn-helix domain-containing protein n=1 Tax=Paracoccus sp. KR1-242 TaxID=3410028 RepID=UPI003C105DD8